MSTPAVAVDRACAPHYIWGGVCEGWRLLDDPLLSVIEEVVPPGAAERRHHHDAAHQFFYVLEGTATLEIDGSVLELQTGQGASVAPGLRHRLSNPGPQRLRFILCSAPSTRGDRIDEDTLP